MARAKDDLATEDSLYQRDYYLWVEEQVRLLREGQLGRLDVANLIEEIDDLGRTQKSAVASNLVVVLKHLLKHQFQPKRRSRSWLGSIDEHRRRLRDDLTDSPSLRRYAHRRFVQRYRDGRRQALIETDLAGEMVPQEPPYTLEQTLDFDFLPE